VGDRRPASRFGRHPRQQRRTLTDIVEHGRLLIGTPVKPAEPIRTAKPPRALAFLPGLSISAQKELAVSAGGGPVSPESSAYAADSSKQIWSGRRDSNPRPQPWQGPPAAYARASLCIPEPAKSLSHQGFSCCSPSQAYPFSIPRLSLCRFPPASPAAAEGARSCDVCSGLKVVTKSANLAQTVA
jgi:hypothetical protein